MLVLCPLVIEARAAERAAHRRATVLTIGPGPDAAERAVLELDAGAADVVILFGVAGGLTDTPLAPAIRAVIDPVTHETYCSPIITAMPPHDSAVLVAGVDAPVRTPPAKRELAERTGAQLVDCESHAFARACRDRGMQWAIVRGVSDGPLESLPIEVSNWVDGRGRTRIGRVALDLMRRPSLLPRILLLGRRSNRALDAAGRRLMTLLDAEGDTLKSP